MNSEVLKSKTTLTAVVGMLIAGIQLYMGDATAAQGLQTGLTALVAIFLRAAIGGVAAKAETAAAAANDAVQAVQQATAQRDTAQGLKPADAGQLPVSMAPAAGEG